MTLYHGSRFIVDKPTYGKGRRNNDYGQGFYCTEDIELAYEWAVDEDRDGYVNIYDIDDDRLDILDLNSEKYCILHWISLLVQNRRFEFNTPLSQEAYRYLSEYFNVDVSNADIIKGYRADDSYFSYAQDFLNGIISVSQLNRAMHLGSLGEQIMIKSRRAFDKIQYMGYEGATSAVWYEKKASRELSARKDYRKMNKEAYRKGELYMVRIIDEEVKPNDPRLR